MSVPCIAFRTDGSQAIGLGHLRRCLALADALRALGAESAFFVTGERRALELLSAAGFAATAVGSQDDGTVIGECCRRAGAAVAVVDSYAVPSGDLTRLAEHLPVAVLDDIGDRELAVDLVVNGSVAAADLAYRGGARTRYLLGPRFAVLRPEFTEAPCREVRTRVRRVLITVGGADPTRLTPRLMTCAVRALGAVTLDVVVGPLFESVEDLRATARTLGTAAILHEDPKDVHGLMLAADLAISGGGQTTYELAATGTPTVALRLADNQTLNIRALHDRGVLMWAGDAEDATFEAALASALRSVAGDRARREEMARRGQTLVDGRGATRVASAILDLAEGRR